jgi:hypothetical protein
MKLLKKALEPPKSPVLGDLKRWGTPPNPRQKEFWTSFSAIS